MGTFLTLVILAAIGFYTFKQIRKTVSAAQKGSCVGCDCSTGKCHLKPGGDSK